MEIRDAPKGRDQKRSATERRRWWFLLVLLFALFAVVGAGFWTFTSFHQRMHDKMRRHGCWDNLREIGLICKMWENEHDGQWPPLSDVPGEFMFPPGVVEDMGAKLSILSCPVESNSSAPGTYPGDKYYVYLGPGLATEEEALAFLDEYLRAVQAGEPLPMPPYLPEEGTRERGDAERAMPVGFHRPGAHNQEYLNVLFTDGSVQAIEMGTRYPATVAFWEKLTAIETAIAATSPSAFRTDGALQTKDQS